MKARYQSKLKIKNIQTITIRKAKTKFKILVFRMNKMSLKKNKSVRVKINQKVIPII
jgi:hypothetical protein